MAKTTDNTQTEQPESAGAPVTFEDMAEDAVRQILDYDADADTEADTDTDTSPAGASAEEPAAEAGTETPETTSDEAPPAEPDAEGESPPAPEEPAPTNVATGPKATVGSVWAHVPEDVRRKVLAIARNVDDQRATAAADDGTGTDQPPAADADKPVVDVADEVLSGTLTRDEVTAKVESVRADGYDDLADALEATADFAAQQTREAGDAVRAVVNLVEAIDRQEVTEQREEQDVQLFVDALSTRPGATDDQLILVYRMVNQGIVTPAEGENPYDLAFQQLEGAGVSLGATEAEAESPTAESDAKRRRRKLAAAASSSSDGGGAETAPELEGFDQESVLQAMNDDHPLFRNLQKQE